MLVCAIDVTKLGKRCARGLTHWYNVFWLIVVSLFCFVNTMSLFSSLTPCSIKNMLSGCPAICGSWVDTRQLLGQHARQFVQGLVEWFFVADHYIQRGGDDLTFDLAG